MTRALTLGAALFVAPAFLASQPGQGAPRDASPQGPRPTQRARGPQGPQGRGAMQGPITHLLNARRQLDLTPRQVAQLDSLERIQYAEHEQFDARMEAERPQLDQRRRRDSSMSAAAERILNDSQRQRAREMQAERRGYERGVRESRAPSHCVKRTPLTPSLSPSVSLTKEPP